MMQSDGLADLLDGFAGAAAVFDIEWKFLLALLGIVFSGVATLVSTIVFCISTSPVARVRARVSPRCVTTTHTHTHTLSVSLPVSSLPASPS